MQITLTFSENEIEEAKRFLEVRAESPAKPLENPVKPQKTATKKKETAKPQEPAEELTAPWEEPAKPQKPAEMPTADVTLKEITMADLRPLALKLIGEERRDELEACLNKFGVKKLKLLPQEHYVEAYAILKEAADNA